MVRLDPKKIKQLALDAQQKIAELEAIEKLKLEQQKSKQRFINKELLRFEKASVLKALEGHKKIIFSWDKNLPELLELLLSKQFSVDKTGYDVQKVFQLELNDICDTLQRDVLNVYEIDNDNVTFVKQSALNLIVNIREMASNGNKNISGAIRERLKDWRESISDPHELKMLNEDTIRVMKKLIFLFSKTLNIFKESEKLTMIFSWKNQEWIHGVRENLINPRTLNWISSGTGQAFFNNFHNAISLAAENGFLQLNLEVDSLGVNEIRWGASEAFRVKYKNTPIGVLPFEPSLLLKIIKHSGFKTSYDVKRGVIYLKW